MTSDRQQAGNRESDLIEAARLQESTVPGATSWHAVSSSTASFLHEPSLANDLPPNMFGGYEIVREIHRGGQGIVYEAVQSGTQQRVAIKVLREGPFASSSEKVRFEREARVLGQLTHPNIVTIHHTGRAHGCFYFVMDFVAGDSIDTYVSRHDLSIRQILAIFAKVCDAVHSAHLRGVVHRDLKPSNVRVDEQGEPHVLDFGLAKLARSDTAPVSRTTGVTVSGQFLGSLPWASPEQANGDPECIDLRTDVYSLGVLLYQLLTGKFPYTVIGHMRDVMEQILEANPIRPSVIRREIDDEVETILLKCLNKESERRYQSADALTCDVRHYLADEPIDAKRDSTLYVIRKQMRRHRVPLAVASCILLLIIGSSIVAWMLYGQARENLWKSYLAQARATRNMVTPGRKFESLKALALAAEIRPTAALRDEAIAAMALADLKILSQKETGIRTPVAVACEPSRSGRYYWLGQVPTGPNAVHLTNGNKLLFSLPPRPFGTGPLFSSDSRLIAVSTKSGCEIWDIERARMIKQIPVEVSHMGHPYAFSLDGREIMIASEDGTIHVQSVISEEKRILPSASPDVHEIRYDEASQIIVTSSIRSHDVLIRDALSGKVIHTLEHPQRVWQVALSPEGSQIAVGCDDGNTYMWDTQTGLRQFTMKGHLSAVTYVDFNSNSTLLFTSSWDGTTRIWDPRTGALRLIIPAKTAKCFGSDSDQLVFITPKHGISQVFAEIVQSEALLSFVGIATPATTDRCQSLKASNDGQWLATASHAGVRVWDQRGGRQIAFLPMGLTMSAVFDPDGSALVTVGEKGVLRWPIVVDSTMAQIGPPEILHPRSNDGLRQSCVSADGRSVVVVARERDYVLVLDAEGRHVLRKIGPHHRVGYLDLSPGDKWLATGSWGGRGVKIWDFATGDFVHELPIGRDASVAFSPDGKFLVTSEAVHVIWEVGTWKEHARFKRETGGAVPGPIAFSQDGHLLALTLGAPPFKVLLVDLTKFERAATLEFPGYTTGAVALTFTPDGTRLLFPHPSEGHILFAWDLRELRRQLAAMDLDWDMPAYPAAHTLEPGQPLRVEVDLGELIHVPHKVSLLGQTRD